jgi:hypothetical protein
MLGKAFNVQQPEYNKYAEAEEAVPVSKAGLGVHLNEQGHIIEELTKAVQMLEDHLAPLTISHPMRPGKDHDLNGDSEFVNAVRVHNGMLIMLIERLADLRSHTQI